VGIVVIVRNTDRAKNATSVGHFKWCAEVTGNLAKHKIAVLTNCVYVVNIAGAKLLYEIIWTPITETMNVLPQLLGGVYFFDARRTRFPAGFNQAGKFNRVSEFG
jgi:hypothetical protein